MARKIIQLSATVSKSFFGEELFVYALCDDGSVWVRRPWGNKEDWYWNRIENIPQD